MKTNSKGFGVVEVFLVAAAILAFGWFWSVGSGKPEPEPVTVSSPADNSAGQERSK
jgi:hypothetical protein